MVNAAEPIIYRLEVLTIMMVLGDIPAELIQVRELLQDDGEEEEETDA